MIGNLEAPHLKPELPKYQVGDTVKVVMKIEEGGKQRFQSFQGVLIAKKGSGVHEAIWVRKISQGIGVEKMFPLHSPLVEQIKILQHGKVRRAKLYYLRSRVGKKARLKRSDI